MLTISIVMDLWLYDSYQAIQGDNAGPAEGTKSGMLYKNFF